MVTNGTTRAHHPARWRGHPSSGRRGACFVGVVLAVLAAGCGEQEAITAVPGDPKAGRAALERYQCGACHTIPGIGGANANVGPPLSEYGQRVYIAGKFPKEPALLAK